MIRGVALPFIASPCQRPWRQWRRWIAWCDKQSEVSHWRSTDRWNDSWYFHFFLIILADEKTFNKVNSIGRVLPCSVCREIRYAIDMSFQSIHGCCCSMLPMIIKLIFNDAISFSRSSLWDHTFRKSPHESDDEEQEGGTMSIEYEEGHEVKRSHK